MPLNRGGTAIAKRFRGTQEIAKKYRGTQLIWENKPPSLMPASGATTPYVTMYIGSSTTEGIIGATDEHHNYVNHFSPMVVAHAQDGISTRKVYKQNSGTATRPTDNGLWFFNAGIGGRTAADYVDSGVLSLANSITPNLFIHMIGSNDYKNQVNPATYQSQIQTVINNLRSRSAANAKHILVHSYIRLDVTGPQTYEWDDYRARLDALASANSDVVAIRVDDLFAARGVFKGSNDPQDLIHDGDNIHATNAGYKFLAESMALRLNMNLRRGQKIWELDPDSLSLADGSAVDSLPTTAGTLETTAATQSGDQRPILVHGAINGRKALKFDGVNDSIGASFSKSYGFPVTQVIVYRPNAGGGPARPIFSRTTGDHMGYIYAFDTEGAGDNTVLQAPSNAAQAKSSFMLNKTQWQVLVIVYEASDDQRVYTNNINPRASETQAPDLSHGPFMTSQRLGSRTNLDAFSPMDLAYARLYQGALTQSEVEAVLSEMGTRFGITISTDPWPSAPPPPATGTDDYAKAFTDNNGDLINTSGWVDHSYSSGQYHQYQGRLVPSGVGNYRTWNNYYYNVQGASKFQYARATIFAPPGSADQRGGVGLVIGHTGTQAIFCKVATNGNWYVYVGPSGNNNSDQADPTFLASGPIGRTINAGDEMIATITKDSRLHFYLANYELTDPAGVDVSSIALGRMKGVIISQTNAGEIADFRCGSLTDQPGQVEYIERTYAQASTSGTSAAWSIPLPPNRQNGDLMVCVLALHNASVNTPGGWSLQTRRTTTAAPRVAIFTRNVDGSEGSTVTLTQTKTANTPAPGCVMLFRNNIPQGSQQIAVAAPNAGTSGTAHTGVAVTNGSDDRALTVRVATSSLAGAAPGNAYTWGAGPTEMIEDMGTVINDPTFTAAWQRPSGSGSQAAVTATHYSSRPWGTAAFVIYSIPIT